MSWISGLPAQDLLGQRDIGLAHLRVIGRERLEDDLRLRARDLDHRLRELQQRELVGVADVDRLVVARLGEGDHPSDEIVDVAERPRLRSVAEDGDRAILERLAQERRDRAAIVGAHPGAVGVEDPDDCRVHALLAVVGHRERLGVSLGLVIDPARPDRIDVTPVALRLGVDLRVAVDLAGGGGEEPCPVLLGHAEGVVGAVGADLQRVQRKPQVIDRRGGRGEVVDEIDRLVDVVRLDDVHALVTEVVGADVLDVGQ